MRTTWVGLALFATASIAGCSAPPRPLPAPTPLPVPEVALSPARPAAPAVFTSRWSFEAGETCHAAARSGAVSLDVTVSNSQVQMTVAGRRVAFPPRVATSIAFTGRSGNWTLRGAAGPHAVQASEPLTEDAVSRVLVLLDGGLVRVEAGHAAVPSLRIPNAGTAGREWFQCVHQRLLP